MIEQLLMSRTFRRYIEAWAIVLVPWVLLMESEAVTMMEFDLTPEEEWKMKGRIMLSDTLPEEKAEMDERRAVWYGNVFGDGTLPQDKKLGFGPHTCDTLCNHELS